MSPFLVICKKYLAVVIIAIFGIIYLFTQSFYMGTRLPVSPDESQALFFSKNLASEKSLIYNNPLNGQYSEDIFAARQYVQRDEDTSPSAFLGYILILAAFQFVNPLLLYTVGPLLAIGSLIFIYLIAKRLFDKKTAIYSILITGTFPVFTYWTTSYYNNMAETFFVLGTIYFAINAVYSKKLSVYGWLGLFAAAAVWIRYTNALLIPLGIIAYAISQRNKISLRGTVVTFLVAILSILPLIVINNTLYGSPLKFGQSTSDQLVYDINDSSIPKEIFPSLVPFRSVEIFASNLQAYLYLFAPAILLLGVVGIVHAWFKVKSIRKEVILLASLAICWLLYYMGGVYFGYGSDPLLSSSYTRYLLIVYIILIIFFSNTVTSFLPKKLQFILVAIVCMGSIYSSVSNITSLKSQSVSSFSWLEEVKKVTPKNSVIFVKGADKILYPERNTALYLTLSKENKYGKDGIDKTILLMKELLNDNIPIYMLKEDDFYTGEPVSSYISALSKRELEVTSYNKELGLYKIGKK